MADNSSLILRRSGDRAQLTTPRVEQKRVAILHIPVDFLKRTDLSADAKILWLTLYAFADWQTGECRVQPANLERLLKWERHKRRAIEQELQKKKLLHVDWRRAVKRRGTETVITCARVYRLPLHVLNHLAEKVPSGGTSWKQNYQPHLVEKVPINSHLPLKKNLSSPNSTFSQDSSIVDVADKGTTAAAFPTSLESNCIVREAFALLGFDKPVGNRKFREAWVRCFAEWKTSTKPYITEAMEDFIQDCEGHIGVPGFFYEAKKEVEQRETALWERANRRPPL